MAKSPRQEASDSCSGSDKSDSVECPTCGDTYGTERGMKMHHAKTHGESIAGFEYECDYCEESIWYKQRRDGNEHFCSKECESKHREENSFLKGVTGIDHPSAKGEILECDVCGNEFYCKKSHLDRRRFCSIECVGMHHRTRTGEDHHRWKGGSSREDYTGIWWVNRRKALERDNYECQICGRGEDELGMNPDVHHTIPVRSFSHSDEAHKLDNLIVLCRDHHRQWEGLYLKPDTRHS